MQQKAIKVEHLKEVLFERELGEHTAGSHRRRAPEEAIKVEHLKEVLLEKKAAGECSSKL